jgi:uncharacterized protein (TIGR00369 family)
MGPLDLTTSPPRSPYATLGGLLMMARTIDKARAQLEGGNPGDYYITPGLSAWLLRKLRFTEEQFVDAVRTVPNEDEIAHLIVQRADAGRIEHLNAYMSNVRVRDLPADMQAVALSAHPNARPDELLLKVLAESDRPTTHCYAAPVVDSWLKLSGTELLNGIKDGSIATAPIFDVLNITMESFGEGWAEFALIPQQYMMNLIGTLHGGVLTTLLDTVMTCALITQLPRGSACTTTDMQVRFFRPLRSDSGRIVARGEVINAGKTLATTQATVRNAAGKLMAHATSTLAVAPAERLLISRVETGPARSTSL